MVSIYRYIVATAERISDEGMANLKFDKKERETMLKNFTDISKKCNSIINSLNTMAIKTANKINSSYTLLAQTQNLEKQLNSRLFNSIFVSNSGGQ
jgi:hypothetical protein